MGLRIVHRWLSTVVNRRRRAGIARRLQEQIVINPDRLARLEERVLRLGTVATAVVLVILYLQTVFWFVPLTRGYTLALLAYLLDPVANLWQGFLANVGNLFSILVILVLARYLLKGLRSLLSAASAELIKLPGIAPSWAPHLYRILRLLVFGVTGVMIYPYIPGSNTDAFKGLGILGGALLTVGASSAVGNFIAGLLLVFSETFRIGDRVKVGDTMGDVLATSMSLTRIRTPKNEVVTYPNAMLLSGHFMNYSAKAREEGLILHTAVTIGYDAPWRKVHELLVQAALRTPGIVPQPAPFVLQTALNDFYITYEINAYTRSANAMLQIYGTLHQNIQDAFSEAGVEIMSPHLTSLRDGNTSTIPRPEKPVEQSGWKGHRVGRVRRPEADPSVKTPGLWTAGPAGSPPGAGADTAGRRQRTHQGSRRTLRGRSSCDSSLPCQGALPLRSLRRRGRSARNGESITERAAPRSIARLAGGN